MRFNKITPVEWADSGSLMDADGIRTSVSTPVNTQCRTLLTVTLEIFIKPLQNCIVVSITLFLTYFSQIVCPYRDNKEIYSRGSLQFKSHNEDCLFVCYGSLTLGQLFRALVRLPEATLEIKFASCPAGGQNCGQWGSHKIISFG